LVAAHRLALRELDSRARDAIKMADHGCIAARLRPRRRRRDQLHTRECHVHPALASLYAANPTEIEVRHDERVAGASKYSLYRLIRLSFDLMTGFSTVPLQFFSLAGLALSLLSGALVAYLLGRRLILGPESRRRVHAVRDRVLLPRQSRSSVSVYSANTSGAFMCRYDSDRATSSAQYSSRSPRRTSSAVAPTAMRCSGARVSARRRDGAHERRRLCLLRRGRALPRLVIRRRGRTAW